jgi:SAM-dependent methyltransferase
VKTRTPEGVPDEAVFGGAYADQYDRLYLDKDYQAECDLIEATFRRHEAEVRTVIDLGCGTGGHAIPLAERGYRITGVDRAEGMIRRAREKAAGLLPSDAVPQFIVGDVRHPHGRRFDAALMMFAVLGYQITNLDVGQALRAVRAGLRVEGLFVFDVWFGPAVLSTRPQERVKVIQSGDDERLIRVATPRLDVVTHTCRVDYRLWQLRGREVVAETTESHTMRFFFPLELELHLEAAGLALQELTSFDGGGEVGADTWNVLAVARAV